MKILIDKVMEAKYKKHNWIIQSLSSNKTKQYRKKELTKQDEELLHIYSDLHSNPLRTSSTFQHLILHHSEAITYMLDKHVTTINETVQQTNRVYLDLSMFNSEEYNLESELSIVNLLFSRFKYKVMEHPLIELMVLLKWKKVWYFFVIGMILNLLYSGIILSFMITSFTNGFSEESKKYSMCLLSGASIIRLLDALLKLGHFVYRMLKRKRQCGGFNILENTSDLFELFFIINTVIAPVLALSSVGKLAKDKLIKF